MVMNKKIGVMASTMLAVTLGAQSQNKSKPNIVYIMADDLGYGDLGCYGQPFIHTPHLDKLASEGMRFLQAYSGSPVSAPARATLMTGQHTGHTEVRGNRGYSWGVPTVWYGNNEEPTRVGQHPYDPDHIILPEILKDNGYTTGMFGKWAGGYEGSYSTPDKRGIDEYYGYICQSQAHLYYPNFLNKYSREEGDTGVVRIILEENIKHPMYGPEYYNRTQYSADLIHQHALDWIGRQTAAKPFVAFLTYTIPHAELVQPLDSLVYKYKDKGDFFIDKTWGGNERGRYNATVNAHAQFAAMISRLDAYVGQVVELLKQKGLDENTIIVFTSDNGPHKEGGADPEFFGRDVRIRGIKRDCLEGGIRIPYIVRWPGHVSAGVTSNHQLAFYDVMPTVCDLIGVKNYEKKYKSKKKKVDFFDGISFLPTLLGKPEQQQKHSFLYWEFAETNQLGVRVDDWKLVVNRGETYLYDLGKDLHEDHDISKQHPDIVKQLVDIIYQEHVESPLFKVTLPQR